MKHFNRTNPSMKFRDHWRRYRLVLFIAAAGVLFLAWTMAHRDKGTPVLAKKMAPIALHFRKLAIQSPSDAKESRTPKSVWEMIAEEQRGLDESGANSNEPLAPLGIHFEPFATAPERRLIQHPTLGEVIEIRYPNGGVLYTLNDERYNIGSMRETGKEF